jgi:hypothetical protein
MRTETEDRDPGPAFVDFEASGLHDESYPVEVGWALPWGPAGSTLIRPAIDWLSWGWDMKAERIHGITREDVVRDGASPADAAAALLAATGGMALHSDNPDHDRDWLAKLCRVAGMDVSEVRDAKLLLQALAAERGHGEVAMRRAKLLAARESKPVHRAGPDARYLATLYRILAEN